MATGRNSAWRRYERLQLSPVGVVPFEKLAHSNEVQLIRAVEDHRLDSQSLPQVFSGFGLSCPCWTCRSSSKLQVESSC
ncbi:hypothetical protein EYF80_048924 [Liparis tanakae]|uniref:Uncharacterized protein n=1 Tax=Liparis tanakae TaxID=230148 RepID=A0A4Z2FI53_9TELE|nr:hypothetical protein EYF80_048924 [Liparis tanakae]